jgi:hypothetical protein
MKKIILALIAVFLPALAGAQTYNTPQFGIDVTGAAPYEMAARYNVAGVLSPWRIWGNFDASGNFTPNFPSTFCSAREWLTATSGVPSCSPISYLASGAGAVSRTLQAKFNAESRTVLDYGAVCDGATNDAAAFAATVAATGGIISVPYSASGCLINTSVSLPNGSAVVGVHGTSAAAKIVTTADVDTFTTAANASNITIHGLKFTHSGNGRILDFDRVEAVTIGDNNFTASNAAATSDMIYVGGSNTSVEGNYFTNSRTAGGWALNIERNADSPGGILINTTVYANTGAGAGKGFHVGMVSGTTRPEGIFITQNHLIWTGGENLQIEDALYVTIDGNTIDQGTANGGLHLRPQSDGLGDIAIIGNWINTQGSSTVGKCLNFDPGASSSISRTTVIGNKFNTCGYGVWTNTILTSNLQIIGNSFTTMGTMAVLSNNATDGLIISGNVCRSCAGNFTLSDGPSGGPIILGGNKWDNANGSSITQTTASNWKFYPDAGRASIAKSSAVLNVAACPAAVNVAHGLAGTPSLLRTSVSLSLPAAGAATITNPNAIITAVDATNVAVSVGCTALGGAGNVNVNVDASL